MLLSLPLHVCYIFLIFQADLLFLFRKLYGREKIPFFFFSSSKFLVIEAALGTHSPVLLSGLEYGVGIWPHYMSVRK